MIISNGFLFVAAIYVLYSGMKINKNDCSPRADNLPYPTTNHPPTPLSS